MHSALLNRKYESELNWQAFFATTLAFMAVVLVCCAALTARTPLGYFDASSLIPLIFLVPGLLFVILNQVIRLRRLKRDIRQSKDIVYGSLSAPLAELQPQPETPDLPLDVRLRQRWGRIIPYFAATTISVLLVGLILDRLSPVISHAASVLLFGALSACWLFLTLPQPPYPETQRIVATEEGLKINDISTIAWNDTRLFALIGPRRRNPSVIFYELADAEESLVFRVRTKPFPWYSWLAPDMSFAEYQAQTQELLGFIVAKTGLPLLDLRG
jgi:uncharacterized integral membrane protein